MPWPQITDAEVLAARPAKNRLDPWIPYAFLIEPERSSQGTIDDVMTIFLTNRECPFRCTMCDLWKNTLDEPVPIGAIPAQIDYAVNRLPSARHIKLYNAGNFFDVQAIPREDYAGIASRIRSFETVIVENHPRLTDNRCVQFRDQIETRLEIAIGLETIHPEILPSLNKRMTVNDFDNAVRFLTREEIDVRVFLLVNPPGLSAEAGIDWAIRSLQHAVNLGVSCISLIPTRPGNGLMDQLQANGRFSPPTIHGMEQVLERGLEYVHRVSPATRVFMDVWNIESFFKCAACGIARSNRIRRMNQTQMAEPDVVCPKGARCDAYQDKKQGSD